VNALAQTRLLQLASQAFPIGGYSHSQGLESAVDAGRVTDEASVQQWIVDVLSFSMNTYELPCLRDMHLAWAARDGTRVEVLNEQFLASRESAELRRATVQMGFSMRALLHVLPDLPDTLARSLQAMPEPSLPCVWGGLAHAWSIDVHDSMIAYAWVWAENLVLVAMKTVPIGQSSGQRILLNMGTRIAASAQEWDLPSDELRSNFAPGLAILSACHETQYSRLFRS
jgi:urease accessory protein